MTAIRESFKKLPRSLIYILLAALAVRVAYLIVYYFMPEWELLTVDNYYHQNWAKDIASGNVFGDTTYFRAPLYVYCLSFLYFLFGTSLWVPRVFGLVIGLVSIFLTYRIAERLFNHRVALVAGLIQVFYPAVLYFESELLLDGLFMLLLELSIYRFLHWYDENSTKNSLWLGLSLGMAAITRPTVLIFLVPILLLAILRKSQSFSGVKSALIVVVSTIVVITPVTIRNVLVGKEFVAIAAQGGINFYIGNNTTADGLSALMPQPLGHNWQIKDITYQAAKSAGRDLKPGEVSQYWYDRAFREIKQEPINFFKLFLKKIYFSLSNREISNNRDLNDFFRRHFLLKFNPLSFGLIFSLSILAIFTGWKAHAGIRLLTVIAFIYVISVALFFFNSRFRLPILPIFFILSAAGIESILYSLKESPRLLLIPGISAAAAAIFSFFPLVQLPLGGASQHLTQIGLHYYFKNNFVSALPYFKDAARVDPTFPETNLNLGACFLRLGLTDSALYYFEAEKQNHPERALSYSNIASVYLLKSRPAEAFNEINEALARKPYHELSQLIRLRAAAQLNTVVSNDSLFKLTLNAVNESKYAVSALNFAAITLTYLKALDQAETLLTRAIALNPPPVETDDNAFTAFFPIAKQNWKKDKALAYYQLGFIYGIRGNFGEAAARSEEAIRQDSNLVEAYVNLINGLNATGKFEKADSVLEVARTRFPDKQLLK